MSRKMQMTDEQRIADRYLRSFVLVDSRLESHLALLEKADSRRSLGAMSMESFSMGGASGDAMFNGLASLEQAARGFERTSGMFADRAAEVEAFVTEVQRVDAEAGKILRLRYVEGLSVAQMVEGRRVERSEKSVYEYWKRGLDIAFGLLAGKE